MPPVSDGWCINRDFFLLRKISDLSNFYFYLSNKNRVIPTLKRERVSVRQIQNRGSKKSCNQKKQDPISNYALKRYNVEIQVLEERQNLYRKREEVIEGTY